MRYFQRFHTAGSPEDDHAEINLSPLVDMVFLLLIFFMVTTSFVSENGIKVNRPEAATATPQAKEALQIALTAQNRIYYSGAEIPVSRVTSLLKHEMGTAPKPVLILADEASASGILVQLIDQCRLAGATSVNVSATLP